MASSARIEELEKKFNENPRRYFAPLANEYRKAGDVQQAIAICRTYVPQQPGHMSGHIVFGQALFEAGDHDEARGVFEAALGLDPENLIALRHLGDIAREHGEADDARAWYRRVLDADPRNDEVAALLTSVEAEQAAAADAPATWTEINPEQTLELPPDVLAAVPRDVGFANASPARSPASSMGELFDAGAAHAASGPDAPGAETLEFRSPAYGSAQGAGYVDEAAKTVPTFVTETMAELYVQQGFYDQALSVYRELLTQHPGDPKLAERMEQLRRESAATPPRPGMDSANAFDVPPTAHSAPDHRSVREFFNDLALRQPRPRAAAPVEPEPVVAPRPANDEGDAAAAAAVSADELAAGDSSADLTHHVTRDVTHEVAGDVAADAEPEPASAAREAEPPAGVSEPVVADAAAATHDALPAHEGQQAPEQPASAEPSQEALEPEQLEPEQLAATTAEGDAGSATDAASEIKPLPRDLDTGFSDASYQETYSAEFGASALTVPDDAAADEDTPGHGLFAVTEEGADSFVVRPSGEADPFALLGFNPSSDASEFDVTAYEGSTVPGLPDEPAAARLEAAPGHADDSGGHATGPEADAAPVEEAAPVATSAPDESAGAVSESVVADAPVSRAAMQTGSVNVLFPERPVSAPDEAAAAALSSAFGGPSFQPEHTPPPAADAKTDERAEPEAEPVSDFTSATGSARPALNELSLDSVFRESPAASPDPRREPSAFSFDQFFGEAPPAAAASNAPSPDPLLSDSLDVGSADAEQFSNWLSGLKKK